MGRWLIRPWYMDQINILDLVLFQDNEKQMYVAVITQL